jgi:hypothetical protein
MSVESRISFLDELEVKALFAASRLVSGNQKNGLSRQIEGKRHSSYSSSGIEPQFLHVRVPGTF